MEKYENNRTGKPLRIKEIIRKEYPHLADRVERKKRGKPFQKRNEPYK